MKDPHALTTALALWREARSVPDAYTAILEVIHNRVQDSRWPNTASEVILQPRQFSSFNEDDPNSVLYPTPRRPADWQAWLDALEALEAAIPAESLTDGANHYHSFGTSTEKYPVKPWLGARATLADLESKETYSLGPFRFYRL
jgi:spore germination cell wall hydrolase CwlJ-like protein